MLFRSTTCRYIVIGKMNGKLQSIVEARIYMGRSSSASKVYCSLWVSGPVYCSGSGSAGDTVITKNRPRLIALLNPLGLSFMGQIILHGATVSQIIKDALILGVVAMVLC